ncbi:MAG TPA: hypothetical protein VHU80_10000 [Polyangiaceae bacterium]|nr:hypothetical protein [Polyangiaceae bacterium]
MNVTSANNVSTVDTQLIVGAAATSPEPPQADATGLGAPATASISGPGRMFHELKQLSESDPTKFKQVVSDMASSLRADAKNASGDDATRLSSIADRLDKVAQSGNLSDMAPSGQNGGAQGAHHHHHGGGHHGGGAVMSDLESAFASATSSDSGASSSNATSTTTGP